MRFLDCPAYLDDGRTVRCGLPAEVRCRFFMCSTDGPLEGAMIRCPAGHSFNGSIESLIWDSRQEHAPGQAWVSPRAGLDRRPGPLAASSGADRLPVRHPRGPEREARRPHGAPAYYLGRPARIYITATRPPRRPAATLLPLLQAR